jgi:molybdopterin-guanine dinucleotide biosynthesis protein A
LPNTPASRTETIVAAILAGGRGERLGGVDKAFLAWEGEPLILRVARRLRPHCRAITVVARDDLDRFATVGLSAIADQTNPVLSGARLGLVTALALIARPPGGDLLLTTPTDLPDLPFDLVARLKAALGESGRLAACVESRGRLHPLIALWTRAGAMNAIAHFSAHPNDSVAALHRALDSAIVHYSAVLGDPFRNINRPADVGPA